MVVAVVVVVVVVVLVIVVAVAVVGGGSLCVMLTVMVRVLDCARTFQHRARSLQPYTLKLDKTNQKAWINPKAALQQCPS